MYCNVELELKDILRCNVLVRISIHEQDWKWIWSFFFFWICSYKHHQKSKVSMKIHSEMIWYKAYIIIINLIREIGTKLYLHRLVGT